MYHFINNHITKPQYTLNVLFQTIFKARIIAIHIL
jgi:hypothetical protein